MKDLNCEVSRRLKLSFLCVSSGAGPCSSEAVAAGVSVDVSPPSPLVIVFSLASFFGRKPAKILARFPFSAFVSGADVCSAAAPSDSPAGAGVDSVASPVSVAATCSVPFAAASGAGSLATALGFHRPGNPEKDLRFSFFSTAGSTH